MRLAPLCLMALVLAGCLEPDAPPAGGGEDVPFRSLLHASNVPVVDGPFEGVLSPAEWDAAWARHAGSHSPAPARPPVDHTRERVVAVALRQHGSGCHDVKIESVAREAGRLVVRTSEFDGDVQGHGCTAQVVTPVHIVAVADLETPLVFHREVVHPPADWTRPEVEARELEDLSVRTLDQGDPSGAAPGEHVLRDAASYRAFWETHAAGRDAAPPPVEMPNETALAVVLGEREDTCFGVRVDSAKHDPVARLTTVLVVEIVGGPGFACLRPLERPFHVVAIPSREGEVRFERIQRLAGSQLEPEEPGAPPPEGPVEEGQYAFRTLSKGMASGVHEPRRVVVADEAAWAALWREHTEGQDPRPTRPSPDFARERVLAVFAGAKPSACHAVRVERVDVGAEEIVAHVVTWTPPADTMCASVVAYPHHVVTFPLDGRPWRIVEEERVGLPRDDAP